MAADKMDEPLDGKSSKGKPIKARRLSGMSDTDDVRWTVRGVPRRVREIAVKAAESRDMTVGDWLSETIVRYVRTGGAGAGPTAARGISATAPLSDIVARLDELAERLTRLEGQQRQGLLERLVARR